MPSLNHLFQSIAIGPINVANRLVMSSMSAGVSLDRDGYPDAAMVAYYTERARGEPGMMGLGAGGVAVPDREPRGNRSALVLYRDECVAPLRTLVDAVHQYRTRIGIQLWDGGIQAGGEVLLTPSGIGVNATAVVNQGLQSTLKVLSEGEIEKLISGFADGAERCRAAGFDFVEIHAGHGYLISSFLTPHFNRRDDRYGGSFDNRTRLLREILRAVKARVGDTLAVGVKINGEDYLPAQGWTLADSLALAPLLEQDGADYLCVTAGVMGSPRLTVPPMYEPQGCFADLAFAIKKVVSIPVSTVGRIKHPRMADEYIAAGKVDLVAMGRPFIADPELASKAREGRLDEIRPCLADCRGCLDQQMRTIKRGERVGTSCIVNPRVGREADCVDIRDHRKPAARTLLVAGAGCAGLEAARMAAFAGHRVILCEAGERIGGQLRLAEKIPGRHEIGDILPWYEVQLARLGVDMRLDTPVDRGLLETLKPDELIVATGSVSGFPQHLMGIIENLASISLLTADEVIGQEADTGNNILVYGGDQIGLQIADYLSEQGKHVTLVEESSHFGEKLAANDRWYLTGRIIAKGVKRIKNITALDVLSDDDVWIVSEGAKIHLPGIDTIVLASERQPERGLVEIANRLGIKTHVIGDARDMLTEDAGTIFSSIAQGYDLARQL